MTKILGKDDLISGELLRRELVPVPSLDASVWMRELSGAHVVAFKKHIDSLRKDGTTTTTIEQDVEIMALVVSFSVCDEKGVLLFGAPEDAKRLTVNNINLLMDLGNKALELSKITIGGGQLKNEVADNLPKAPPTSLLENSQES